MTEGKVFVVHFCPTLFHHQTALLVVDEFSLVASGKAATQQRLGGIYLLRCGKDANFHCCLLAVQWNYTKLFRGLPLRGKLQLKSIPAIFGAFFWTDVRRIASANLHFDFAQYYEGKNLLYFVPVPYLAATFTHNPELHVFPLIFAFCFMD